MISDVLRTVLIGVEELSPSDMRVGRWLEEAGGGGGSILVFLLFISFREQAAGPRAPAWILSGGQDCK